MKKFVITLVGIGVVLAAGNVMLSIASPAWSTPVWPWLLMFFIVSNTVLYWLFNKAQQKKLSSFANYFMIATFTKLLLYLAVILIYVWFNRSGAVAFILTFFVYYVVFTAFEVLSVSKQKH